MDPGNLDPWIEHWNMIANRTFPSPPRIRREPIVLRSIGAEALGLDKPVFTDKEGRFQLSGFGQERVVELEMRGKGVATMHVRAITRKGQMKTSQFFTFAQVELIVQPGRTIEGTVRERRSKQPAAGVHVSCGQVRTTTDEKGRYRLEGVPKLAEREYTVLSFGGMYFASTRTVVDAPGVEKIKFDFELDGAIMLAGNLTDAKTNQPIAGRVQYIAQADNPYLKDYPDFKGTGFVQAPGNAQQDGQFQLPIIPGKGWLCVTALDEKAYPQAVFENGDGILIKGVPDGLLTTRFHAIVPLDVDPNLKKPLKVEVSLQPGQPRHGRILDPEGKPLSGVRAVGLHPISFMDDYFINSDPLKDDRFIVHGINPRRERVLVFYHLDKKLGKVMHVPGAETGELKVKLAPMGSVQGRLIDDKTKKPMPGTRVTVEISRRLADYNDLPDELLQEHKKHLLRVVMTDEDGRFNVDGLVPGLKYNLVCSDGELRPGVTIFSHREDIRIEPGKATDLGELQGQPMR
jgi:hypothetical protein